MRRTSRITSIAASAVAFLSIQCQSGLAQSTPTPAQYFQVRLKPGDAVENIFERTLYLDAPRRISGYATYVIKHVAGNRYDLTSSWAYYGRAGKENDSQAVELAPDGLYYISGSVRVLATDSSGAFFNTWLWGTPPDQIAPGTTWTRQIPTAWELGPAGMQTARVVSVDPTNDRIVLERTGSGVGAPLDEKLHAIDGVMPSWGKTTWKGTTIVRDGLIESDQIVVHHELIVPKTAAKPQHSVTMIEQVELGQVPYDGALP
jgi:hypothetical protein